MTNVGSLHLGWGEQLHDESADGRRYVGASGMICCDNLVYCAAARMYSILGWIMGEINAENLSNT